MTTEAKGVDVPITPGPWTLGRGYGNSGIEVVGDDGNRLVCGVIGCFKDRREKDGRLIETIPNLEGIGNANLIAAAPDLRSALQGFVSLVEKRKEELGELSAEMQRALDAGRAALARLQGGKGGDL